jgi:DNA-binding beta-propeller fold protein YncE
MKARATLAAFAVATLAACAAPSHDPPAVPIGPEEGTILSPDAGTAYFAALTPEGAAVFRAGAAAVPVERLSEPGLFVAPSGIDVSLDGAMLYVADPGVDEAEDGAGAVFALSTSGGAVSRIASTAGYAPRGICVAHVDGAEWVYFSGIDPSGAPGVFRMPPSGGPVSAVASGAPFADPAGLAVARNGDVYAIDSTGADSTFARLFRVSGAATQVLLENLRVGYPAGVALSPNDQVLLVSALDPVRRTDAVIRYHVATGKTERVSTGIDGFTEPAGLHRAHEADAYVWADSGADPDGPSAAGAGTVFVINQKPIQE